MLTPALEANTLHAGIVSLVVSVFAYVGYGVFPSRQVLRQVGWWTMAVSFGLLLCSLVVRSLTAQYFALSNMFESLLVLMLWMQLGFLVVDAKLKLPVLGWPSALLILTGVAYDTTLSRDIKPLQAALQSYWRSIHVPIIILSYALFTLAFVVAVVRICLPARQAQNLNSKPLNSAAGGTGGNVNLPPLAGYTPEILDELIYRFTSLGFPLLAIGIILGGLWANEAWGNYWSWDPKESMSLVTLLGYGVYLHMRVNGEHNPKRLAWISVAGFALMLVTYFGVNLLGIGLHSYGKIG
jgi:cytochrome c-type biogenesis protein CcsB